MEVDFALVCATHSKLREEADKGRFRSDLYYRINGLTIQLPPLRERTDFQALTHRLLAGLNPDRSVRLGTEVLQKMEKHGWPGNLRQLASVLRTASAMLDPDEDCIGWSHLPDDVVDDLMAHTPPTVEVPTLRISSSLEELAKTAMQQALESSKGNVSHAARILGVSRQTLYRKMAQDRNITCGR
jgi:transcriptional regulator of acetoin/glycerol metabolism